MRVTPSLPQRGRQPKGASPLDHHYLNAYKLKCSTGRGSTAPERPWLHHTRQDLVISSKIRSRFFFFNHDHDPYQNCFWKNQGSIFRSNSISDFTGKIGSRFAEKNRSLIEKPFPDYNYRWNVKSVPDFFMKIDPRIAEKNRSLKKMFQSNRNFSFSIAIMIPIKIRSGKIRDRFSDQIRSAIFWGPGYSGIYIFSPEALDEGTVYLKNFLLFSGLFPLTSFSGTS